MPTKKAIETGVSSTQKRTKKFKADLLKKQEQIVASYRERSKVSFNCFTRGLTIASQTGPQVFEPCMAEFQRECFEDLEPNLNALRLGHMPKMRRFWIERTKKASKDADLAVMMLWLLAFPVRPIYLQVGAANKFQAAIVKDRMSHLLHWNPWLTKHVEIVQWQVRSTKKMENGEPMAKLEIMSSDVSGAHGGTPDLLIINELSHVDKWEFVENLMDNADGVAQGIVVIATNAGFKGTKAEIWRNNAIVSEDWSIHVWKRPAPWHDTKTIRDAKARNSKSRYRRLWWGTWASGKGDALDESHIDRCFCLEGPTLEPEPGWFYIGGLDLGIKHDHAGLVILGVNQEKQKIRLCRFNAWEPPEKGEIDLTQIEETCRQLHSIYRLKWMFYDPYEARLMAQRLKKAGVPTREIPFQSSKNQVAMATSLVQVIEANKLECFDDQQKRLRRDFGKFNVVEKSYGIRLEAVRDEFGHADVGTALVMCLPYAVEFLAGYIVLKEDDILIDQGETELTEEELENMPEFLRGIYELDDDRDDIDEIENQGTSLYEDIF